MSPGSPPTEAPHWSTLTIVWFTAFWVSLPADIFHFVRVCTESTYICYTQYFMLLWYVMLHTIFHVTMICYYVIFLYIFFSFWIFVFYFEVYEKSRKEAGNQMQRPEGAKIQIYALNNKKMAYCKVMKRRAWNFLLQVASLLLNFMPTNIASSVFIFQLLKL